MAKKTTDEPVKAAPVPVVEPPPVPRDPTKTIGLESGIHGEYLYLDAPPEWHRDTRILYNGQNYEATATDRDGCWIYRTMK